MMDESRFRCFFSFCWVNYKLMKVEGHVADTFGLLPVEASTVSMGCCEAFFVGLQGNEQDYVLVEPVDNGGFLLPDL